MPIEIVPGERAWATYRANALARWPTRESPQRLHPLADPVASRPFTLRGDERVFCIGSCFARSIENALERLGFEVLSLMPDLPRSPNRDRSDRGMFNKYNVATILNELRWALGEGKPYRHEDVLIAPPGDRLLQDYQLAGPGYSEEPGFARAFREGFNAAFARVREADLVILTLGLSEIWLDTATGLHLNAAPLEHLVRAYPGRYELHVMDVAQTLAQLEEIDRLLVAHLESGFRLMVTVSPVPLWSTFRDQDVLTANTYSKAVLRVAAEAFVAARAHASYFPSFEFAQLSHPTLVYSREDFRHVDARFVDYIMQSALQQYGASARDEMAHAREHTRALLLRHAGWPGSGIAGASWRARLHAWLRHAWLARRDRKQAHDAAPPVRGYLDRWDGSALSGWAFVTGEPGPARVSIRVDEREVASARADLDRPDVAAELGEAHRRSGFHIPLEAQALAGESLGVWVAGRLLMTLPLRPQASEEQPATVRRG
jgi:hypothetical protein